MGRATFKMVAAGDGSPQSPSGYNFLLLAHAVATALLLITLVAAVWEFMDWVVAPTCSGEGALTSVSSTAPASPAPDLAPVPPKPLLAGEVLRGSGRLGAAATAPSSYQGTARAQITSSAAECLCPQDR